MATPKQTAYSKILKMMHSVTGSDYQTSEDIVQDVKKFLTCATDEQFRRRFPDYKGERINFRYDIYRRCEFERRLLLNVKGVELLTVREARRAYKISLEAQQKKWELEKRKSEPEAKDRRNNDECLRCLLISNGTVFIPERVLHSCQVEMAPGEYTEEDVDLDQEVMEQNNYQEVLETSTTLAAFDNRSAITKQTTLQERIDIDLGKVIVKQEKYDTDHVCLRSNVTLHAAKKVKLVKGRSQVRTPKFQVVAKDRTLIYAPTRFGKTTLQMKLQSRGMAVIDTDDLPGCTSVDVQRLLKTTTVITNRLDIVRLTQNTQLVIFNAKTPSALRAKMNVSHAMSCNSAEKLWDAIRAQGDRPNTAYCIVDASYVSQWFRFEEPECMPEVYSTKGVEVQGHATRGVT